MADADTPARDSMQYDVVIVGGGPAGLAAAIRLKQLAVEAGAELSVALVEKGSEVGAHILSGAVIDPRGLSELIPDWKAKGAPLETPVTDDRFVVLTETDAIDISLLPMPPFLKNHGAYIASLANLCRWLAGQAEALGVEIYPGMAASVVVYGERGVV
jgi:electron-transferring-flavoprotein dehydrogenase